MTIRPPETLPAKTENNPREHLKVVTLRSGKETKGIGQSSEPTLKDYVGEPANEPTEKNTEEKKDEEPFQSQHPNGDLPPKKVTIPFPSRVKKSKDEKAFKKFLDIMGQVEVKLPLVDVLTRCQRIREGQSTERPPLFNGTNYSYWKERMKIFIQSVDYKSWMRINNGLCLLTKKVGKKRILKSEEEYTDDDFMKVEQNAKALHLLFCAIDVEVFQIFSGYVSAKKLWDDIQEKYETLEEAIEEPQICFMANEEEEMADFPANGLDLPFVTPEAHDRYRDWGSKKVLTPPMILDHAALENMGYWEEVDDFLHDPKWRRLLSLRAQASVPLTMEFICSLRFSVYGSRVRDVEGVHPSVHMTFTLRGTRFDIPVLDLGRLLGIYTHEETSSPDFLALPRRLPLDVDVKAFWRTHSHSTRDFSNKYSSSSDWRSPAWRILSHLLCCSYFGSHKNANRVYDTDLIFFWSLESHTPVDLSSFVGCFLFDQSTGNRHHIQARPIITLLAYALMPTIVISDLLPEESSVRPITSESLIHMGFRKRPRDTRYEPNHDTGTGSPSYMPASMPADGASSSAVPRPLPTTFEELTTAFGDLRTSIDSRFQLYEQWWTSFEQRQELCWKEIHDHQQRIETSLAEQGTQIAHILDYVEAQQGVPSTTRQRGRGRGQGGGRGQ
ncbi:unnamed protein product [Cuscuta campestris]|uniref:Arabidopsis retrotransposon Orf1 C-terminal domain-containing protein n=1 Tax=Cuscuta campestris TaxID=132261 RepID=A0A484MVJ8_9ASTE|nr:unnamed protein product [Cuscuta campestris]